MIKTREMVTDLGVWPSICPDQKFMIKRVYKLSMGVIEKKD